MLLAERLRGSGLRLDLVDGARPLEDQVGDVVALVPSVARIDASVIAAAALMTAGGKRPAQLVSMPTGSRAEDQNLHQLP